MLEGSTLILIWHQSKGRAYAFSLASLKDILDPSNVQFLLLLGPDSIEDCRSPVP